MHVLYVDDSGSVGNADERYFILGGISVFERGIYHLIKAADDCVDAFGLGDPQDIELHATHIYSGKRGVWKSIRERGKREDLLQCVVSTLARQSRAVTLFAVAIDKAAVSPRDPIEMAFEEICNRFNMFLRRIKNRTGEDQRGLIVMDESKHERPLQQLARSFRLDGSHFGQFRHLAEVPLFVDSEATRLIQLADLVAWATWRKYEHKDGRFFDPLLPRFDQDGGVIHGLYHARSLAGGPCYCPACQSREQRDRLRLIQGDAR